MRRCEFCADWAQWRLLYPEKDKQPKDWKQQLLCNTHKQAVEAGPSEAERKFAFIGVAPLPGIPCS